LYNFGISPNNLRIGKEVEPLFRPCTFKNGYKYSFSDEKLISNVETLWMATQQKTQVPSSQLINKAKAQGIMYEKKGKQIN
jgi:phosphopantetheine adenylyltransferase